MLLSPPSLYVSSIASRYHPLALLTHPIVEFSFLAHPDLPYHIIHGESLFTFASSCLIVFSFLLVFFSLVSSWPLCTYYRYFMDIDANETLKFRGRTHPLCSPSPSLSKTRSLNGSRVLTTCRASFWPEFMVPYPKEKIGTVVFNVGRNQ